MLDLLESEERSAQKAVYDLMGIILQTQSQQVGKLPREFLAAIEKSGRNAALERGAVRLLASRGESLAQYADIVGRLLLQWLRSSQSEDDLMGLVLACFEGSLSHFPERTVIEITGEVCDSCSAAVSNQDEIVVRRCLQYAEVMAECRVIAIPVVELLVRMLCTTINIGGSRAQKVMVTLLRGCRGSEAFSVLLRDLQIVSQDNLSKDPLKVIAVRGAIFFACNFSWGSQRIPELGVSFEAVLQPLQSAIRCGHMDIVIEGVFAIQRLIKKYGKALAASEWSHLQSIITYAAHDPKLSCYGPGEHRHKEQSRSLQAVENDGGWRFNNQRGAEREREGNGKRKLNAALALTVRRSSCSPSK